MMAGDIRAFYEVARAQAQAQPEWLGVYLADGERHDPVPHHRPVGAPACEAVRPRQPAAGAEPAPPVVGRIARGKGGRAAVPVRIPVTDSHGSAYVLSAVVKPDRILRVIERQRAPSDSVIAVIDAYGRIVARSKNQERFVTQPITPGLREADAQERPGGRRRDLHQGRRRRHRLQQHVALRLDGGRRNRPRPPCAPASRRHRRVRRRHRAVAGGLHRPGLLAVGRIVRAFNGLRRAAAALGAGRQVSVPHLAHPRTGPHGPGARSRGRQRAPRANVRACWPRSKTRWSRRAGPARPRTNSWRCSGHELRNPLSPIVASLDLMDMRDEPGARANAPSCGAR
jgi:hypothetical protein